MAGREVDESRDSLKTCKYMEPSQYTFHEKGINSDDNLTRECHGDRRTYLDSL